MQRSSTSRSTRPLGSLGLVALIVLHVIIGSTAARPLDAYPESFISDVGLLSDLVQLDGRHWRDHEVAYPPLLVAEVELVITPSVPESGPRLGWSQLLLHLGVAAAMAWGWGRRGATAYLLVSLPFLVYPFVLQRTDLLAVALSVLGVAAWKRSHSTGAGVLLALAFFAKAWPVVLGPGLAATSRWRAAAAWLATLVGGTAAWVLYGGPDALVQVFTFRGATGAQIESVPGNVISIVSDAAWRDEQGAARVGDLPSLVRLALPALGLALSLLAWTLVWRRVRAGRPALAHGVGSLTAVTGLLATATLFSTQFTSWLLPWAAIVAAELPHRDRWGLPQHRDEVALVALTVVMAAAAGPLMWIHPDVAHGDAGLWLLTVRNVALLGVLGVGLHRLWLLEPLDEATATPSAALDAGVAAQS